MRTGQQTLVAVKVKVSTKRRHPACQTVRSSRHASYALELTKQTLVRSRVFVLTVGTVDRTVVSAIFEEVICGRVLSAAVTLLNSASEASGAPIGAGLTGKVRHPSVFTERTVGDAG